MNTQLVDSLVQIIESLTLEEKKLLEEKLQATKNKPDWQENQQKLIELQKQIFARRGGKPLDPPLDYYIQEARDERNAQQDELVKQCFNKEQKE
jgi:hypothetical protein